ncbi:DUF4279 domain-containing protein [Saprospiraceae bacterium]|nr:DUF4279 domain-containing protein [Saprospiraceae bacterium]
MGFRPLKKNEFSKIFKNQGEEGINQNHIKFSISGFEFNHESISRNLGLTPTKVYSVGEKIIWNNKVTRIVNENLWEYEWKNKSNEFLPDWVEEFIAEIIEPRIESILSVSENCVVMLTIIQYYYTSHNPGYLFSSKSIEILSKINSELQLDIYCLRDD